MLTNRPGAPPGHPAGAGRERRRRRRRAHPRAVDDHDEDGGHQRDAAADRVAGGHGLRDRAGGGPALGGRRGPRGIAAKSTIPVIADIHFQWKYAMAALEAGIQGLRINPGNIKYQDKVRLDRARGQGPRRADPDRRERRLAGEGPAREVRPAHARGAGRVGAERGQDPRGRGLLRHQDLGEALQPGDDDPGLPAARREVRLPAPPRRHRGRADADGRGEVRGGDRSAPGGGDRRHDPGVADRRPGRGGQGRRRGSSSRSVCASAGWTWWPARRAAGPRSTCSG